MMKHKNGKSFLKLRLFMVQELVFLFAQQKYLVVGTTFPIIKGIFAAEVCNSIAILSSKTNMGILWRPAPTLKNGTALHSIKQGPN